MSRSIIQTAVNNKTLRLELEYLQPSRPRQGDAGIAHPMTDTGLILRHVDPQAWDEFVHLLRVI